MDIEQVKVRFGFGERCDRGYPYGNDWLIFRIGSKIFILYMAESPEPTCAIRN